MEDQNYTIKDIARMAGVSAGTVDRVLHNRGDVSPKSKAKVQKVLDEIHYQPNVFAIGLAAKKKYSFLCLIPLCKRLLHDNDASFHELNIRVETVSRYIHRKFHVRFVDSIFY